MGIMSWGLGKGVAHPLKVIATNAKQANNDSQCGLFIRIPSGLTGICCVRNANWNLDRKAVYRAHRDASTSLAPISVPAQSSRVRNPSSGCG
jgi:hypothetical protein